MNIPHSKPRLESADASAVTAVLESGMIASGAVVTRFEEAVAARERLAAGVACGSGTAALVLALRAVGVSDGKGVVLPTYVCEDVLSAVLSAGGRPVLCDVGPHWLMTPESVKPHLDDGIAAIVLVHAFGFAAPVAAFAALGVPVVADACQAFGVPGGADADAVVFSFHATKCLTTGEGGMAVFRDRELAVRARALRDGETKRVPSPMSDLQAALGLRQLEAYPAFIARRRAIAQRYAEALASSAVRLPAYGADDAFFRFPVRGDARGYAEIASLFAAKGVQVRRGVDALLHRKLSLPDAGFPSACGLFNETVSLPLYPALTDAEVEAVARAAREIFEDVQ